LDGPSASLARDACEGREAGFTLVELAVATLVLMLAVLLACDLLAESGRVLHHSVPRSRDPWTLLAAELLRNDLRGGSFRSDSSWDRLRLTLEGEGLVEWARESDELVRTVEHGRRFSYLRNVRDFRWDMHDGGAIEVRVRFRVSSPYLRQLAGSLPRSDPGQEQTLRVLIVSRGGGSDEW
jgi:hypothetical protein